VGLLGLSVLLARGRRCTGPGLGRTRIIHDVLVYAAERVQHSDGLQLDV
jgi:hypothetical protein